MNNFTCIINYTEYEICPKLESDYAINYNIYYNFNGVRIHLLKGYIKWDGCSNWDFIECRTCMLHACGRASLNYFSELPQVCWDHCSKHLESFDLEVAKD